jgi:hypothetical protein
MHIQFFGDTSKASENQAFRQEGPLVRINAKTAPYPAARSWSGGRRRILGERALESSAYHVVSAFPDPTSPRGSHSSSDGGADWVI